MLIGLTGIIGSGKSSVAKILQNEYKAEIIDADRLGHQALDIAYNKLKDSFGEVILNSDGTLNRQAISNIVFNDKDALKKLQDIVHPVIHKLFKEEVKRITSQNKDKLIVYDAPLLFEAGYNSEDFDYIVVVAAPEELCISRACKRNNCSAKEIKNRLQNQWPLERKISLANFIINNISDLDSLKRETADVMAMILSN